MSRERELLGTLVELADTLVADYDVVDMLHRLVSRSARLLNAADAGILIPNGDGSLDVVASTSERSQLIELLQLDAEDGPCLEAYRTGRIVTADSLVTARERWPQFASVAGELGYESVHAIPLRLREQVIGSLNLFGNEAGPLDPRDAAAAQGLADIATIGILHQRAIRESDLTRRHLQNALDSRVVIEQAKGVVAQADRIDPDEAFRRLRERARTTQRPLLEVAQSVVDQAGAG